MTKQYFDMFAAIVAIVVTQSWLYLPFINHAAAGALSSFAARTSALRRIPRL